MRQKIFINDYGVFVGCKGDRVVVKKKGKVILERAAAEVAQIVLCTRGAALSSAFLRLALRYNIDVVVLSGSGLPLGRLSRPGKGGVRVRKEQYRAQNDLRGVHLAKQMARAKVFNQRSLLREWARSVGKRDPALAKHVMGVVYDMDQHIKNIEAVEASTTEKARARIMFEEARAAEKYWSCVKLLLADVVDFPGRKKRFDRPEDPVNIMLNYGYYVLASTVWLAVEATPLDPYVGFLHADSSRRPALVMDLMEEFRQPVVDRVVFRLAREGLAGFVREGRLTREGRGRLLRELASRLKTRITISSVCRPIEDHIFLQARKICRFLMGKTAEYVPFTTR